MTMTRKHFVAIAAAVKENHDMPGVTDKDKEIYRLAVADVAKSLADTLRQSNGAFDRCRFLRACGVAA
jgi:hypothetical protein